MVDLVYACELDIWGTWLNHDANTIVDVKDTVLIPKHCIHIADKGGATLMLGGDAHVQDLKIIVKIIASEFCI